MKKFIALMLCILMCMMSLISCNKAQTDEQTTETTQVDEQPTVAPSGMKRDVVLGYYANQSLNPFVTKSETNKLLSHLLFETLIIVDEKYDAQCSLAQSFKIEGNALKVSLKQDLVFSDNSTITPADVVYSFENAKNSLFYSSQLNNISVARIDSNEIVFSLNTIDVFSATCLDFPIVKYGTAQDEIPLGSGRYVVDKDDEGKLILVANEKFNGEETMSTQTVKLMDLEGLENELYLIQIGDLSYYLDYLDKPTNEKLSCNLSSISTNNLVFLGINGEKAVLKDDNVKSALYNSIDIKEISELAFEAHAKPTNSVFNPSWSQVVEFNDLIQTVDINIANSLLEKSEWVLSNSMVRTKGEDTLKLKLIVSEENLPRVECANMIKDDLKVVGIEVEVEALKYDDYIIALEKGEFDLYVGEIKLNANMDLAPFLETNGSANYGIGNNEVLKGSYTDFQSAKIDASTFIKVFDEQRVLIPICYREHLAYFNREMKYTFTSNLNDPFKNFSTWCF